MSEVHNLTWRAMPVALLTSDYRVLDLDWRDRGVLSALFAVCDDFGRFTAHARQLSLQLGWTDGPTKLKNIIGRFVSLGFVKLYQAGGRQLGEVVGYCGLVPRQRERQAYYPAPPGADPLPDPLGHPLATPLCDPPSTPLGHPLATEERSKKQENRKQRQAGKPVAEATPRATHARDGGFVAPGASPAGPPVPPPDIRVSAPPEQPPWAPPVPPPETGKPRPNGLETKAFALVPPSPEPENVSEPVKKTVSRWQKRLGAEQPAMLIRDEQLHALVDEFGEERFLSGIRRHLEEPAGSKYWQRFPLQGLRKRCEWAEDAAPVVMAPKAPAAPALEEQAAIARYHAAWREKHAAAIRNQTWQRVLADLDGGRVSLAQVTSWVRPLGVELSRDRTEVTLHAPDESHGLVIGDAGWPLRSPMMDAIERHFGPVAVRCVTDAGEVELWRHEPPKLAVATHGGLMAAGAA